MAAPVRSTADFVQAEAVVHFDGEFRAYAECRLGPMTHALHYGTGCFEGIRAYWSGREGRLLVFRGREHYRRLHQSARILGMAVPLSPEQLMALTVELLQRNRFETDAYVRPLVYKAGEEIGVRLTGVRDGFLVYAAPFGDYVDIHRGLRCMVSSWRRIDDCMAPARAKITGSYVNAALAKSEAVDNGFDEAIMLGADGHVSEGSAENLFLVRAGTLVTPAVTDNILEGITRSTLLHLWSEDLGLPVQERSVDRSELYTADEVFLCGTGAQVSPVVEIDRRQVGDGGVGAYATRLQSLYFDVVRGEVEKYREWCTPVG
ncbi:MAG TPA: branched-chain amino acid transaminase [Candidatus Micrarchaeia archaeon]|nr:branched-chain amino acid transaminase [Candidatus Micrarchaeia archaeon]